MDAAPLSHRWCNLFIRDVIHGNGLAGGGGGNNELELFLPGDPVSLSDHSLYGERNRCLSNSQRGWGGKESHALLNLTLRDRYIDQSRARAVPLLVARNAARGADNAPCLVSRI